MLRAPATAAPAPVSGANVDLSLNARGFLERLAANCTSPRSDAPAWVQAPARSRARRRGLARAPRRARAGEVVGHGDRALDGARDSQGAGELDGPGVELDFRNNIVFNWNDSKAGYSGATEPSFTNFVNNYYIGGPGNGTGDTEALREEIGPFGTLLMTGHDWDQPKLWRRSMELLATDVMPKLSRHAR